MSTDPTMAENRKLDMSLDDIIRLDGIKGPRRGGGRSGPPGGGGGRRDNFSRGSGGSNGRYQPKRLNTGGGFRANSYNGDRSYQQSRSGYSNGGGGGGYRGRSSAVANGFEGGRGLGGRRQCTLHVSNLASTVNAEDVEELFSTFGDLVRSTVHYDQHGSSLGTADVVFEQRENATEARHKLNNVPLDGKPLRITMLNETDDDPFQSFLRMGNNSNRRNGGGGGDHYHQQNRSNHYQNNNRSSNRMSGGGGGGGGGGNRGPRRDNNGRSGGGGGGGGGPAPSAEDLDKEMDDWRMQVDADKN